MLDYNASDEEFDEWLDMRQDDAKEGWQRLQQMLSEDEMWAQAQFEAFHGREY